MNKTPDDPGVQFSPEQIKHLRDMADHHAEYEEIRKTVERSQWLGRLLWKTLIVIAGAAAGFVAFKNHIVELARWIVR